MGVCTILSPGPALSCQSWMPTLQNMCFLRHTQNELQRECLLGGQGDGCSSSKAPMKLGMPKAILETSAVSWLSLVSHHQCIPPWRMVSHSLVQTPVAVIQHVRHLHEGAVFADGCGTDNVTEVDHDFFLQLWLHNVHPFQRLYHQPWEQHKFKALSPEPFCLVQPGPFRHQVFPVYRTQL